MECALCGFGASLEAVLGRDAYRKGRGAHRAGPQCVFLTGTTHTQGTVHWVLHAAHIDKSLRSFPNFLKSFVKSIKLQGKLYNITCPSNFVNDMVVLCL